jgi:alpha-beta hydrolase superfamily lysophospholipase
MPVPAFPEDAHLEEGFLDRHGRLRLYWRRYSPAAPRATVVVIHGGGDHSGRYPGVTAALVHAGCEVALFDLRGHGRSDGNRWHIESFSDYLEDVDAFLGKVRADANGRKIFVLAHSMGGLIAAQWGLDPGRGIAGFVISQPYLANASAVPAFKVLAGRLAGAVFPSLPIKTGLESSDLTSDPDMQAWTDSDPLYIRTTTARWVAETLRAQAYVLGHASEFSYPLLVLLGTADPISSASAGRAFFESARSVDKEARQYEGYLHELFNESKRELPILDAVSWIEARAQKKELLGREAPATRDRGTSTSPLSAAGDAGP